MNIITILLAFGAVSLIFLVGRFIGYQDGYMTAVEERFEEETHNENY
jgi:hypothetical protein